MQTVNASVARARHHPAQRARQQAEPVRHHHQQRLVLARAQHGADLGVLVEADQEKGADASRAGAGTRNPQGFALILGRAAGSENASARLPFGLVQPGARAALQLLLAQDTGQFVTRQSSAQDAFPADEKQTYRCKCARERQAQCEQVTLTHGAPYLETLGVVVRKETQGL
nr:hypothetical protein [Achromobacter xylosoxidans]